MNSVEKELRKFATKKRAKVNAWFFKTGKGHYGEGDVFIGVTVPDTRKVAKKFTHLPFKDLKTVLKNKVHEIRLVALLILVQQYEKGDERTKKKITDFYLKNTKYVNNWDLVDLTAPKILGDYLLTKNTSVLDKLARSEDLWERRIAIVATFAFITKRRFKETVRISNLLLNDEHDLIHKAVGWMLRELGKKDQATEERFLKQHYKHMPRTTLRYAIERFSDNKKKFYMSKS